MFKVANIDTIRAIMGQGEHPLTPSAFADFLEMLQGLQVEGDTKSLDRHRTLVLCDEAGQQLQLDLKAILPTQIRPHVSLVWKAIRQDDLESTIQLRNVIFGKTWLTVTIGKEPSEDPDRHRFEAILAPSGSLKDTARYVKSRGAFAQSIAHLAACSRAIIPAAKAAGLSESVKAFVAAISGDNPVHYMLAIDMLPGAVFAHVKYDIVHALDHRQHSMGSARDVQLVLLGEQSRAFLHQAGEAGQNWVCRMTMPEQDGGISVESPPCRDAARALVAGALLAYVRDVETQKGEAA